MKTAHGMAPIGAMPFCCASVRCQRAVRGADALAIVGVPHKACFDAYLDQMHDFERVSVADVLPDPAEQGAFIFL